MPAKNIYTPNKIIKTFLTSLTIDLFSIFQNTIISKQGGIMIASVELAKAPINEINKSIHLKFVKISHF